MDREDEPGSQAGNDAARDRFQVASPYYDKRTKPSSLASAIIRVPVPGDTQAAAPIGT
jgi:hypothetical protein